MSSSPRFSYYNIQKGFDRAISTKPEAKIFSNIWNADGGLLSTINIHRLTQKLFLIILILFSYSNPLILIYIILGGLFVQNILL